MSDLVRFEFRRLLRRTSLYVCFGISMLFVVSVLQSVIQSYVYGVNSSFMSIVRQMISVANLPSIVTIFTSIFICEDMARGTVKTIYSLGYPRWQIFSARFLASSAAAAAMYVIVVLIGLITGLIFQSTAVDDDPASFAAVYIVWQFTILMALHAFYFLIAEMTQKTGISIVLGIFGTSIVSIGFNMLFALCSGLAYKNIPLSEAIDHISSVFNMYWLPTLATMFINLFGLSDGINYLASILVNIGYVLLFGGLALLITCKKEIKN